MIHNSPELKRNRIPGNINKSGLLPYVQPDPYFSYNVLLTHLTGTNNGVVFTDIMGKTITRNGSVITSTAQSKYAGSSTYFPNNSSYLSLSASNDWYFPSDFNIQCWLWVNSGSTLAYRVLGMANQDSWEIHINNGILYFYATAYNFNMTIPIQIWFHFQVSRISGILYMFLDGILKNTQSNNANIGSNSSPLYIGNAYGNNNMFELSYMQDLQIKKGVGLNFSDFTPPTQLLPDL